MTPEIIPADHPGASTHAARVVAAGGLVILPTDTVYGIGGNLWNPHAVKALFEAKDRPQERAIPILLSHARQIAQVASYVPEAANKLGEAFWPGPLTIAVPKRADVSRYLTSLPTVGVRVPDHSAARSIIAACGGTLAVTSANRSGESSPLTAEEALASLGDSVALVLDGGPCPGGVPSTVVTFNGDEVEVVREGPISEAMIKAALNA